MSPPELSDGVVALLRDHVTSYEHLEALLLLRKRRADPHSAFNAIELAEQLHMAETTAMQVLSDLRTAQFISATAEARPSYRYEPASPGMAAVVDNLAEAWERDRLKVMNSMSSGAVDRVRTEAIRMFANAFLIGQGKKKDG